MIDIVIRFSILLLLSILPVGLAVAQDFHGKWSVEFFENGVSVKNQNWTLFQATVLRTPYIGGIGSDADGGAFTLQGTHSISRTTFTELKLPTSYNLVLEGPITSADSFNCGWSDTDVRVGTCVGTRITKDIGKVSPGLVLEEPPSVIVQATVSIFVFRRFNGISRVRSSGRKSIRYATEITRVADGKVIRKTSKKNSLMLTDLQSGHYSTRYRVEIVTKVGDRNVVVGRTNYSPVASFTVL